MCSTDHGRTFTAWETPNTAGLRGVLVDGDRVWVVGEYGMIATTSDGGKTWDEQKVRTGAICLYKIARDPSGSLWIVADNGTVVRRKNDKWKKVPDESSGRILEIVFDPRDGRPWLLDDPGVLQRWTGKHFEIVRLGKLANTRVLTAIARTHTGTLILIGDRGLLLRSTTDGKKWAEVKFRGKPPTVAIEAILVTKFGILAVGGGGMLLVSHDDGATWRRVPTGVKHGLWSLALVEGGLVIGADNMAIFHVTTAELAKLRRDALEKDAVLAGLAGHVITNEPGAEMVLEDALRERDLWG